MLLTLAQLLLNLFIALYYNIINNTRKKGLDLRKNKRKLYGLKLPIEQNTT